MSVRSTLKKMEQTRVGSVALALAIIALAALVIYGFKAVADAALPDATEATQANQKATSDSSWELKTDSIDLAEIEALGVPAVIDFGSDECIPCKQMAPVLRHTNAAMRGKALVKFVDVWEYPNAANGFPIQVIPTQVLVNADGTPFVPSAELEKKFNLQFSYYNDKSGKLAFTTHQGALTQEQMDAILSEMGA